MLTGACKPSGVAAAGRVCPFLVEIVGFRLARWLLSWRTGSYRCCAFFGSCGWGAGVQALGSRLDPPIIEARRGLDLVAKGGRFLSLRSWLGAACWGRFRFALRLGEGGLGA